MLSSDPPDFFNKNCNGVDRSGCSTAALIGWFVCVIVWLWCFNILQFGSELMLLGADFGGSWPATLQGKMAVFVKGVWSDMSRLLYTIRKLVQTQRGRLSGSRERSSVAHGFIMLRLQNYLRNDKYPSISTPSSNLSGKYTKTWQYFN